MKVEGYAVQRAIGRGGMATAHLAIQESLQREVVLKTLNSRDQESSDFVERFLNEGRMVASLQHPNIITIFDIGSEGEVVYIAMEYVEGGDLRERIDGGMPIDEALSIIISVAKALDHAHQHGIVHRDVKPANILFRSDGTPLLSDFGIAKEVSGDAELTSTGTILGSPFYMSPEQSEGYVVDGRTDIYSLGVILYEMLTGERPYKGETAIKVIMQHIQSPLPKLPRALSAYQPLLELMMAKQRDKRPRTAAQVAVEVGHYLEELAQTEGDESSAPGNTEPSISGARAAVTGRHRRARGLDSRRLVAALAVIVVVVLAGGAWYVYEESTRPSVLVRRAGSSAALVADPQAIPATLAEPAAPDPATVDSSGVERRDVVKALLWLARNSLRDDRLTHPPADNAYYYYSRLLALEQDSPEAKQGFLEIAERFVVLAELEYSRKQYPKAQAYVTLGLQVDPDNAGLASLQTFIDNRERGLLESVMNLIRGE